MPLVIERKSGRPRKPLKLASRLKRLLLFSIEQHRVERSLAQFIDLLDLEIAGFDERLKLKSVRQPNQRVTGSNASVNAPRSGISLVKWLTTTILPPGLHTRLASAIMRTGSGTTVTT